METDEWLRERQISWEDIPERDLLADEVERLQADLDRYRALAAELLVAYDKRKQATFHTRLRVVAEQARRLLAG